MQFQFQYTKCRVEFIVIAKFSTLTLVGVLYVALLNIQISRKSQYNSIYIPQHIPYNINTHITYIKLQ